MAGVSAVAAIFSAPPPRLELVPSRTPRFSPRSLRRPGRHRAHRAAAVIETILTHVGLHTALAHSPPLETSPRSEVVPAWSVHSSGAVARACVCPTAPRWLRLALDILVACTRRSHPAAANSRGARNGGTGVLGIAVPSIVGDPPNANSYHSTARARTLHHLLALVAKHLHSSFEAILLLLLTWLRRCRWPGPSLLQAP